MKALDFLHFLFALGLFTQMTKLGELLILPAQQKLLQYKVELWALQIESLNPLKWYPLLISQQRVKFFTFLSTRTAVALTVGSFITLFALGWFGWPLFVFFLIMGEDFSDIASSTVLTIILAGLVIVFVRLLLIRFRQSAEQRMLYIYAEGNRKLFMLRFFFLCLHSAIYLLVLSGLIKIMLSYDETYTIVALILFFTIFIIRLKDILICYTLLYVGFAILVALFLLLIVSSFTWVAKGLVYRVAVYNKGAFAGITLVITAILGLVEAYFKLNT